uniref:Uncharacterized protein n=1 Tax=Alexandrium catenella TaxID=2925 RepID=A0A7S1MCV9_ALECA|mmetsp:Transcript_24369/g.66471  ORF Transcript_24369/g.66471 Transcript_24369/m.66471 type:complete len:144 (+) Transcript_24369:87-518(+)
MAGISLIDSLPLPPSRKKQPAVVEHVAKTDLFPGSQGMAALNDSGSEVIDFKHESNPRWVTVHTDDGDEVVEINPERGPVWFSSVDGARVVPDKLGYKCSGGSQKWGNKPWYAMGSTEREVLLLQVARHQQYIKRMGKSFVPF